LALRSYRDLEVWQKAMRLIVECYHCTKAFPAEERFGLTAQIRRASVSVASNIAEGHERRHIGDYLRHISISRGSPAEIETEFLAAEELGLVRRRDLAKVYLLCDDVSRMLTKLRRSLEHLKPTAHRGPRTADRALS
jgi:four helix bundle protein